MENPAKSDYQGKNHRIPTPPPIPQTSQITQPSLQRQFVSRANCHKCQKKDAQRSLSYEDYQRWIAHRGCVIRYCEECSLKIRCKVERMKQKT